MSGKPYQSKILPYAAELSAMRQAGRSYRQIADELNRKYGLKLSHNAVYSFTHARLARRGIPQLFFENLAPDLRDQLVKRIAAIWTHDSTAIEGNTLTLGETVKVLELGLTINGKSLREHQEVYGHARAIDLVYGMIRQPKVNKEDLFALHQAMMDKSPMDIMNPVGDWKRDFNGTTGVIDGKSVYMEYASPLDVPSLMERWLKEFNRQLDGGTTSKKAMQACVWAHMSFVRIHPFFDGNGRMARAIANLPVLRGGYPPVVVPREKRARYIDLLWAYQNAVGKIQADSPLAPPHPVIREFLDFLMNEWRLTLELVEEARARMAERNRNGW